MPLRTSCIISFLSTTKAAEARVFFEELVGLSFTEESDFALVFATGNGQLRIQKVQDHFPVPYTSVGWDVGDIEAVVSVLAQRGVVFEKHDGLEQSEEGIWISPIGAKIAWFKDPDGNTLSLTQQ